MGAAGRGVSPEGGQEQMTWDRVYLAGIALCFVVIAILAASPALR